MTNTVFALAKKEWCDLFRSATAYVFLTVFLALSFWIFFSGAFVAGETSLRAFFLWLPLLFVMLLPVITMGLWVAERRNGTMELLCASPVGEGGLVLGKFLAGVLFLLITLALTSPVVVVFSRLGDLDAGTVFASYAGIVLLGTACLSVGFFVSGICSSQIVAFLVTVVILFLNYMMAEPLITAYLSNTLIPVALQMAFFTHFEPFARGVVDTRDLVFFCSTIFLFLFLNTATLIRQKRWAQPLIALILVCGIVIGANVLAAKWHRRLDLTADREFSLSPATKAIAGRLADNLTIKLYFSKDLPTALAPVREHVLDLVNEIKASTKAPVLVQEMDPGKNEAMLNEMATLGIAPLEFNQKNQDSIEVKKVYMGLALYYQDKREVLPAITQTGVFEYNMAVALLKLTTKKLPRVGVLVGSDRQEYSLAQALVKQIGELVTIDRDMALVAKKDIKELVIMNPVDLDPKWGATLDNLLQEGVNVVVFAGRTTVGDNLVAKPVNTGLDNWLAEKGVFISNELVLDTVQNLQAGFATGMVQVYLPYAFWVRTFKDNLNRENPITLQLEDILFPWTNAITVYDDRNVPWEAAELVRTSTNAFLQPKGPSNVSPNYVNEMTEMPELSNFPLSVVLTHKKDLHVGKVFVTATHQMIEDGFLDQAPANAVFFANMVEFGSWGNELIGIRSRGKTARPLISLSQETKTTIKWAHVAGIPVATVLIGLLVLFWAKQRRKAFIKSIILKGKSDI